MEVRKIKKIEPLNKGNSTTTIINEIDYSIATKITSFLLKEGILTEDEKEAINTENINTFKPLLGPLILGYTRD